MATDRSRPPQGAATASPAPTRSLLDRLTSSIADLSLGLAAVCMVAMAALVTLMVLSRFFLHEPLAELFEFSEYAVLAVTMLAAPLLLRTDEHIKMDLLSEFLGPDHRLVRATDWVVAIVVGLVALSVTWFSMEQLVADVVSGTITQTYLAPVRWPLIALVVLGSAGMTVEALRRLLDLVAGRPARTENPVVPAEVTDLPPGH